jgi:hypothetical protein
MIARLRLQLLIFEVEQTPSEFLQVLRPKGWVNHQDRAPKDAWAEFSTREARVATGFSSDHSFDNNVHREAEPLVALAGQRQLSEKNSARSLDFKRLRFVLLSS